MTNPVRVVLFDLGGVLVEFTGSATLLRWLGDRVTPEQVWPMWLGSSVVRDFETGRVGPEVFADRLIADLGLPVDRRQFLADFAGWPKALFAGAADLVGRIPPSYLRATLSNTNVLHWPRLTGDLGLGALFDHHFPSHVMGKLKPDRAVFAHVAQTLRCEPSAILFLDDQPLNVHAALAAGVRAVRVSGVHEAESALTELGVLPARR
jgi:putative hydrolase of the HAD superfamily